MPPEHSPTGDPRSTLLSMAFNILIPEILSQIFLCAMVDFPNHEEAAGGRKSSFEAFTQLYDIPSSHSSPSLPCSDLGKRVSHVCHHWRKVSIAAPALWSKVQYTLGQDQGKMGVWLARSSEASLDINIQDGRRLPFQSEKASLNAALLVLIAHIRRWKTFSLHLTDDRLMRHALHVYLYPAEGARRLTSLALSYISTPEPGFLFDQTTIQGLGSLFTGRTPQLTHVRLDGVHIVWSLNALLKRLKYLRIANHEVDGNMSWADFAKILTDSPELGTLDIDNSGPTHNGHRWPRDLISLPYVRRLILHNLDPEYCRALISRWDLPSLRELDLKFDDGQPSRVIAEDFIGGHNSLFLSLETLTLSNVNSPVNAVNFMYHNLPCLSSLSLDLENLPYHFLTQIFAPDVLPKLDSLAVVGGSKWTLHLQYIVEEREKLGIPLKKLFIAPDDGVVEELSTWFLTHVDHFTWR